VRFICGTQDFHKQLENTISGFMKSGGACLCLGHWDRI
jgi:7-keto-8-aminopelargonate synthetase-like enzyme